MARFLLIVLFFSLPALSQCIPISDAAQHIGKKTCVAGKVMKVIKSDHGAYLLDFCGGTTACPFTVRAFPIDFPYVGDVRQLAGKEIEITGKIKQWNHQAEIVLKDADQVHGASGKPMEAPKDYDAERQSLKRYSGNNTGKRAHKRERNDSNDEIDPD